jgi:hypothetical protein
MKGFLNKVRRQSSDEGSAAAVEQAPKADVTIPAKRERRFLVLFQTELSYLLQLFII